jgi:hypothetical protein
MGQVGRRKGGRVYKQSLPLTSSLCHSQGVGFLNDDMEGFAWCLSPRSLEPYAGFWDSVDGLSLSCIVRQVVDLREL